MSDPSAQDPPEGPVNDPEDPTPPGAGQAADEARRYDANLKLIRRRLADESKTNKPRWWWLGR